MLALVNRILRIYADVRITASGLPKTSGTISIAIQLDRPGDASHGYYWSTASGGTWSASPTYPTMTHAAGAGWYYDLPAAATLAKQLGRIVVVAVSDNLATPASETVVCGNLSTYELVRHTTDMIVDEIEYQRGAHTGHGDVLYVSPNSGGTLAGGFDGSKIKPLSTLAEAITTIQSGTPGRHSTIFLVADGASGVTTHSSSSTVTINKPYVRILGPGRDFQIIRSAAGDTVTITASGVMISGCQIDTHTTGSGAGVSVSGADFVALEKVWFNDTRGDGIYFDSGTNHRVMNCHFQSTGSSGAGNGINVTTGCDNVWIKHNHFDSVQGDAIQLTGNPSNTLICDNQIHNQTGYGINIGAAATDTFVCNNLIEDTGSGTINNGAGTSTLLFNNGDMAEAVWSDTDYETYGTGTPGEKLESLTGALSGTSTVTATITDQSAAAVPAVFVHVYDSTNTTYQGTAIANASGIASFNLDDGDYVARLARVNFQPNDPSEAFTVSGATAVAWSGIVYSVPNETDNYEQRPMRRQRVRYNDANDDNKLVYQFAIDGAKVTPTSATISIYASGSTTALVSAAAMTASGTLLTYAVDTTTTASWPVANGYRADVIVTYGGVTYPRHFIFDVVKYVLKLNVNRDTLDAIDSAIQGMEHGGDEDFSPLIEFCKDEIQARIEAKVVEDRKLLQDMVLDYSGLEVCLAYRVLAQIWQNNGDTVRSESYKKQSDMLLSTVLSTMGYDQSQTGSEGSRGKVQEVRILT